MSMSALDKTETDLFIAVAHRTCTAVRCISAVTTDQLMRLSIEGHPLAKVDFKKALHVWKSKKLAAILANSNVELVIYDEHISC